MSAGNGEADFPRQNCYTEYMQVNIDPDGNSQQITSIELTDDEVRQAVANFIIEKLYPHNGQPLFRNVSISSAPENVVLRWDEVQCTSNGAIVNIPKT